MIRPTDRRPPMPTRRELGEITGKQKGERVSEYFDFAAHPEKADRKVTRGELLGILTRKWRIEQESRWYRRLWAFLKARTGSKPVPIGGGSNGDQ